MTLPLESLLRTTLVFALALAVTRLLRRQSAAFRHVLWICAFGIAAATPALMQLGPVLFIERPAGTVPLRAAAPAGNRDPQPLPATAPPRKIPVLAIVWITGIAIGAIRLGNASRRARAIVKSATVLDISARPPIVETDAVSSPMTTGIFRPSILLPSEHRLWTPERRRAVLQHELAHVRRHDCLVQWLPNLVCAVYWFNPLAWFARSEMLCESERACDDAVIRSGISGGTFARDLVEIAQSIQQKGNSLMSASLITKLERRITRLIDPAANRRPLTWAGGVCGFTLSLLLLAPIAGVRAEQTSLKQVVRAAPSKTVVAPVKTPGQIAQIVPAVHALPIAQAPQPSSTGSLAGVVTDPTGAVVPDATIALQGAGAAGYTTITDSMGRWSVANIAPGTYSVTIQHRGFQPYSAPQTAVVAGGNNQVDSRLAVGNVSAAVTVTAQRSNAAPAAIRPVPDPLRPVRVGGMVEPAKVIRMVRPVYPPSVRERGIEGVVKFEAVIGKDGLLREPLPVPGNAPPEMVQAALEAVRQWIFEPSRLNGEPVEVLMTLDVNFQLQ